MNLLHRPQRHDKDKLFFPLKIEEQLQVRPLLDTGSEICLLSKNLYDKLTDTSRIQEANFSTIILDANKKIIHQSLAPKMLRLQVGDVSIVHPVCIIDKRDECIVGLCLFKELKLNLVHNTKGELKLLMGNPDTPLASLETWSHKLPGVFELTTKTEAKLDSLCTTAVTCELHTPGDAQVLALDTIIHVQLENCTVSPWKVQPGNYESNNGIIKVDVTNIASHPVVIPEGTSLSEKFTSAGNSPQEVDCLSSDRVRHSSDLLEEPDEEGLIDLEPPGLLLPSECPEIDYHSEIRNHPTIPSALKDKFLSFLTTKVQGLCSTTEVDFGTLKLDLKFDIELKDEKKYHTAVPYQLNTIRAQQLQRALVELEEVGILEKGDSAYTSPAFIIAKAPDKSGCRKTRVIFDHRELNMNTKKLHHPLPHIPTLLQNLQGGYLYSTLDLKGAFHNVLLTDRAQERAAVVTSRGVYRPKRLVFGLTNAPSFFCYVMSEVLKGIPSCEVYLDDIIICTKSQDPSEHLDDIMRVLQRLHEAGLKINILKGQYFAQEVKFLGKILDSEGIRPLENHVVAIKNFPQPKTRKELQRFLGLLAFTCCFIYDFSQKTEPLTKLMRTGQKFEWRTEQDQAFEALKLAMSTQCKSFHPDYNSPLYLATDVCQNSFASVLYQVKSYSKDDLENLTKLAASNSFLDASIPTYHPVLPNPAKGVPPPLDLAQISCNRIGLSYSPKTGDSDAVLLEKSKIHVVRPIGYTSSLFRGAMANYTILEKEASAIVHAITYFQQHLYCSEKAFVLTDSQSFLWALRFRTLGISRLERICIKLLAIPFRIIITHIKGALQPADFLTRVYKVPDRDADVTNFTAKRAIVVKTPFPPGSIVTPQDIINELLHDPEIVKIPSRQSLRDNVAGAQIISKHTLTTCRLNLHTTLDQIQDALSIPNIKAAQKQDHRLNDIISGILGDSPTTNYTYVKGLLYYTPSKEDDSNAYPRIALPQALLTWVLAYYHFQNHSGGKTLAKTIKCDFHASYIEVQATNFTKACHLCHQYKPTSTLKTPLGHAPFPLSKCRDWHFDFVTGLTESQGYTGYLSIIDAYSGFRLAIPVRKSISALQTVTLIERHVLQPFGIPARLTSDQGSQLLQSQEFINFTEFHGIKRHIGVAHSGKSHGIIESSNRRITELLRVLADQYNVPWPRILHYVTICLNSRPYARLGHLSPYEVMFGFKCTNLRNKIANGNQYLDITDQKRAFRSLQSKLDRIMKQAEANRLKRNKEKFPHAKMRAYRPDDLIYTKTFYEGKDRKSKQLYYPAPLVILRDYGHTVLAQSHIGLVKLLHKDNIRPCPVREYQIFDALPLSAKQAFGFPFDPAAVADMIKSGHIPDFWHKPDSTPPGASVAIQPRTKPVPQKSVILHPEDPEVDYLFTRGRAKLYGPSVFPSSPPSSPPPPISSPTDTDSDDDNIDTEGDPDIGALSSDDSTTPNMPSSQPRVTFDLPSIPESPE